MSRKNLIPLLRDNPMPLRYIARQLEATVPEIADDLIHLEKSLIHTEWKLVVHPAACRKCGFRFGEDKLKKPARCPECKSNYLTEPEVEIRHRGNG